MTFADNIAKYAHAGSFAYSTSLSQDSVAVILPGRTREDVSVTHDRGITRVKVVAKQVGGLNLPAVDLNLRFGTDAVTATMQDGILTLRNPAPQPRTIPVG